jgi:hypothetical protein
MARPAPTPLAKAITELLEQEPLTADELSRRLLRSRAVIRNTLATMYFNDQTIACDAAGRHSPRSHPSPNGMARIGYLNEREGDGFV